MSDKQEEIDKANYNRLDARHFFGDEYVDSIFIQIEEDKKSSKKEL